MVMFTCGTCGQAVKKNQVEKHYMQQCRNCQSLSCMDCNKEFWGDDYKEHIKCISEDQKYGGKDFVPKPNANKGEVKQEKWIEHMKQTIRTTNVPRSVASLLENLMEFTNIPRKKSKFENFLKNSVRVKNEKLINDTWEIFSKSHNDCDEITNKLVKPQNSCTTENNIHKRKLHNESNSELNTNNNEDSDNKPKKKRRHEENGVSTATENNSTPDMETEENLEKCKKFKWKKMMKNILLQHSNNMSIKKLRKKVLKEFKAFDETSTFTKDDLTAKFDKILHNNSKFCINEDRVQYQD